VYRRQSAKKFIMRSSLAFVLLLSMFAPQMLKADVTIRYKMDVKLGPLIPPEVAQQAAKGQKMPVPPVIVIQVKGDKAYSNAALTASLIDFTKEEITVMDSNKKLFATVSTKDYAGEWSAAMPPIPPIPPVAEKILETVKADVSCHKTGRLDTILGVQVEEEECTLSLSMPVPPNLPFPPGLFQPGQPVTILKFVQQRWTATESEVTRVPALGELLTYNSSRAQLMDITALVQQVLTKLPFIGQNLASMIEDLSKNKSPMLKTHTEIYLPVLVQIAPILQTQAHPLPPGFDPNAALAETDMVATELSNAPIADSVFHVPDDYHVTTLPDLLKSLMPTPNAKGSVPPPQAALPQPGSQTPGQQTPAQQTPAQQAPGPQYDKAIFQKPVPSDQLAFLKNFNGSPVSALIQDKQFNKLLHSVVPDCLFHYGHDMPLVDALTTVLAGPALPVQIRDGRYVMVAGSGGLHGEGRGFMWIDLQDGIALGGFTFHPNNGEPTPTLTIFSKQIKVKSLEMNQLPAAFAKDLYQWSGPAHLQPVETRYFITGSNEKIVLEHEEDYCAPADGSDAPSAAVCDKMDVDAADIDVDAAYYVEQTGHAPNATARMIDGEDQAEWVQLRVNACGIGPDQVRCHIRMARERTHVIINRHPMPHVPRR
jgi:hypothetical protein